jgi:hypothetical protein
MNTGYLHLTLKKPQLCVGFRIITAVTMKRDVTMCRPAVHRLFGATYCLHLQGRKVSQAKSSKKQDACCTYLDGLRNYAQIRCQGRWCASRDSNRVPQSEMLTPELICSVYRAVLAVVMTRRMSVHAGTQTQYLYWN